MSNPGPLLNEKLPLLPICLQTNRGNDLVAKEHGQSE